MIPGRLYGTGGKPLFDGRQPLAYHSLLPVKSSILPSRADWPRRKPVLLLRFERSFLLRPVKPEYERPTHDVCIIKCSGYPALFRSW